MLQNHKIPAFQKTHTMLDDDPSETMSAAELKAWWDSAPEQARVAINGVVDDLTSTTAGSSGADQVGSAPITGVNGDTVYEQISDIRTQFGNVVLGQIPDATITQQKLVSDLQGKLNQIVPLEREVANLKAASSIANRVDGASGIFYDLMDGLNGGSIAKLDTTRTNVDGAGTPLAAGSTTCAVKSSFGLFTGMEVTFQDIVTPTKFERVVLTGVNGNTLTFAPLVNNYADQAVVYRSLVNVDNNARTMKFGRATMPTLESLTKVTDPATMPTVATSGVAYTTDGQYMAATSTTSPFLRMYKITGGAISKLPDPVSMPASGANCVAFSYDGSYMAVGLATAPFIAIYKKNGDTFDRLGDPAGGLPASAVYCLAFSPDGAHLSMGVGTSPYITLYKRTGDSFSKLANPATLPSAVGYSVAYSSDSVYLAFGNAVLYKRGGDTYTKLANPATVPGGNAYGSSFSPDTTYLAILSTVSPFIYIYKRVVDTFTKLPDPASLPPGAPNGLYGPALAFAGDGNYLALAIGTTPFAVTYKRTGDAFAKQADPNVLPAGAANSVAIAQDSSYITYGLNVAPFLITYSGGSGVDVNQVDVRYNITPPSNIKSVTAWVDHETDAGLDVSGAMSVHSTLESFAAMDEKSAPVSATIQEDQFSGMAPTANSKATLRLTATRNNASLNKNITQIMGAVGT